SGRRAQRERDVRRDPITQPRRRRAGPRAGGVGLALLALIAVAISPGAGQAQRPTPAQVRARLEGSPDLAGRVRDWIAASGLTADVELAHTIEVTREGFLVIPQVGQLYVAGLTLGELESLLYTRLGRVYSGVRRGPGATTRFQVTVARLRTNQVYVVGDVVRP